MIITTLHLLALLQRADQQKLSPNDQRFLLLLETGTADNPTGIAKQMKLTTSGASNLGKSLQRRKLVKSYREENDERKVRYQLTAKGQDKIKTLTNPEP